MPLDLRDFNRDSGPNQALYKIADTLQENKRYKQEKDYRHQKDEEANQYRNYNIISDNTDINKSLTGIPAIDKVYSDKMKVVYNELVAAAGKLSPLELAGMVNEKTSPIYSALNAARTDYANGQKRISEMTAQSKELDKAKLTNDLTNRAIQNYIDPKTGQPISPDAAHSLDFSMYDDPEYLSDFVSDENLVKGIRNPVGAENTTVLAGKPHDYTEYQTKNTLWTEPAYDQSKFDNKGFYTGGDIPQRRIKAQQIPLGNGSIDIISDDVYNAFTGDKATHAAIIARAKKEFPTYYKFNANEKKIAEKNALYKYVKENDDTQLHPVKTVAPPVTTVRVNAGSTPKSQIPLNLTEYSKEGDDYDVTSLAPGINVTRIGSKTLAADKILYNPSTKKVTFTDIQGNKKTESFEKFRQDIATINTGVDLSFIDRLAVSGGGGGKQAPKMVTMVLPNGTAGQIPEDKVADFLKDNPKAKRQ